MKKIKLIALIILVNTVSFAQQTNFVPTTGSVYFGTPTNGVANGINLQLHGTYELCSKAIVDNGPKAPGVFCYKTSRFLMTNTTTGLAANDGMLFKMSGTSFSMINQERKDIFIGTNGLNLRFSGVSKRLWLGYHANIHGQEYANMNIIANNDNGLFLRVNKNNKFGLSIEMRKLTDNAIQVMGIDGDTRNFSVQANGNVYARKYTTTLSNIPDYVFNADYNLMSFNDLRLFVNTNHHLPNVPSAAQYEENGVDLGEMNRVLLEKTEELTLYILQLEERLTKLEEQK